MTEQYTRRLAAVLCADVKDYSRHMGRDESRTLQRLSECRTIVDSCIAEFHGRIANTAGDSVVTEFGSVVDCINCAVEMQQRLAAWNAAAARDDSFSYRIGINVGDIIARGDDILGDDVNIAARLEAQAQPGGICISGAVYDSVRNKVPHEFRPLGERRLKNISEPVRVFSVAVAAHATGEPAHVPGTLPLPDRPSIAVLPFDNMSPDPGEEYFSDGLTEDIITDLAKISGLFVIARHSSFAFKNAAGDLKQIGAQLGVRWLLEGSVRRSLDRVRITAQLIEAATGNHVWAERFDRPAQDIFRVQDEITAQIVASLSVKLIGREQELVRRCETENLEAHDLLMRGRSQFYQFGRAAVTRAQDLIRQAVKADPGYAEAHAFLATTIVYQYLSGWLPQTGASLSPALELSRQAIALDRDCALGYGSLGWALVWSRNAPEGMREIRRGLALEPNDARMHMFLSFCLSAMGEGESALQHARLGKRLDPNSVLTIDSAMANAFLILGNWRESLECCRRVIRTHRDFLPAYVIGITPAFELGLESEAMEMAQNVRRLSPDFIIGMWQIFIPGTDIGQRFRANLERAGFRAEV
ncbi:MAG: adenylate/guanylate cyclase domain-containing protein [Gammaproteobacteria bacterium]|nr:adenylate/guanylate cyclase domain-containing protein [Gammaproteobacteria bacterium]